MQENFLDSKKGRFLAYRTRQKRIFTLWWSGKLQSKRSASPEVNSQFQRDVLAAMKASGHRAPFTGPLMVDILFSASARNAPEVQSLAKHYLDLLHRPVAGGQVFRSLLKEERLGTPIRKGSRSKQSERYAMRFTTG
jgi:hypothetical protein